jgi:hypothetical protein
MLEEARGMLELEEMTEEEGEEGREKLEELEEESLLTPEEGGLG